MRKFLPALAWAGLSLCALGSAQAQTVVQIAANHTADIEKPSRMTIGPVIAELAAPGDPMAVRLREASGTKTLGARKSDHVLFFLPPDPAGFALTDLTDAGAGTAGTSDILELNPNARERGLIASALVQFTISDPDPLKRANALTPIAQAPNTESLAPLRAAIDTEPDATMKAQKRRLERRLTLRFDADPKARVAAMASFGADAGLDLRASLTPLIATTRIVSTGQPQGKNIAHALKAGSDLTPEAAYDILLADGSSPARISHEDQKKDLAAHIENGMVAGIPLAQLSDQATRDRA